MSAREARGVHSEHPAIHAVARLIVILVALGAAVLSFDALTELAQAAGIHAGLAWIWAVVIDGFILVATLAAFALEKRSRLVKGYAWLCLAVFTVFSILGNGWHAAIIASPDEHPLPIWVAVTVTGIPPVALFLAIHLLFIMLTPTERQREEWKKEELAERQREREAEAATRAAARAAREANRPEKPKAAQPAKPRPVTPPKQVQPAPQTLTQPPTPATVPVVASSAPEGGEALTEAPKVEVYDTTGATEYTREQLEQLYDQLLSRGEELPGPAATARMLGRTSTVGSRFLKKFKEDRALV